MVESRGRRGPVGIDGRVLRVWPVVRDYKSGKIEIRHTDGSVEVVREPDVTVEKN